MFEKDYDSHTLKIARKLIRYKAVSVNFEKDPASLNYHLLRNRVDINKKNSRKDTG